MSIISALTYSVTDYFQTYDQTSSTNTNKTDASTSVQPKDTYESSSELIIFGGGEKEDGTLYYSYDDGQFPKRMSAYNDGSLPYKLTISEVNAAGYQPKTQRKHILPLLLLQASVEKNMDSNLLMESPKRQKESLLT
jgi:hypothetical protein